MAVFETWLKCELKKPVNVKNLTGNLFSQDSQANVINVEVFNDGQPYTLSGTVTANVIRADGGTVTAQGSFDGNVATVTLPAAAYVVAGPVAVIIKNTVSEAITTLAAFTAYVYRSSTETVIDPGTIVPSVEALIEQIQEAVESIPADYSGLWASIAPAYSTSGRYAAGAYCTYDGGVWKCIVPITTPESWTEAHWSAVDVGGDLSAIQNHIKMIEKSDIGVSADTVGYLNTNGVLQTSATGWHTKFTEKIPCVPGWKFRYIGGTSGSSVKSVLFFNGSTAVSQERYAMGSDVTVTVPSGVDSVIFQSAASTSTIISLEVEKIAPETIESMSGKIAELQESVADTDADLAVFESNATPLYPFIITTSAQYSGVTQMCLICSVPAGTRISRIDTMGANNANTNGQIPTLQILEKVADTDNDYRVVYTQKLGALKKEEFTQNITDIYCENDSVIAIGNTGYIAKYTFNSWTYVQTTKVYELASVGSDGVVTVANQANNYKLLFNIRLYANPDNIYPSVAEKVESLNKIVQVPELLPDISMYTRVTSYGTNSVWSPRTIPANKKITKVRFYANESGNGFIGFADYSLQATIARIFILKKISVSYSEGWNEVAVNATFDRPVNIGFYGLSMLTVRNNDIPLANIDSRYFYHTESVGYGQSTAMTDEGTWTSGGGWTSATYELIIPFVWFYEDGTQYAQNVNIEKLSEAVALIPNNAPLRTMPVMPKYKVLPDQQAGFVGKWYETEVNGENAHVCNAFGGEFYFRTKGTTSVTIGWDMGALAEHSYYAYNIDGGAFTAHVSISSPTITLPDDGYHIVRVVCDSLSDNITGSPAQWSVGGGFVVHGIDAGSGTVVGMLPEKEKLIVHLGDSITVGTRAYGQPPSGGIESDYHSVVNSYAWHISESLNAISYMDAYGGTGLYNGGSTAKCSVMIDYAAPDIPAAPINADLVVLEHGHNDSTRSDADFKIAYQEILTQIRGAYPGAPIVCLIPFNRQKAAVIQEVVEDETNCYLIDCEWIYPYRFYADGPGHLTAEGGAVVGNWIAQEIRKRHLL